ncbi:OLC1v1013077C1 [Oldenlandia corymbosa var. corymbosa]|uniref:OLC1v1013077C1 n=1 Tax=Oldenlandia corymbosa var. corymbosa TaxID=529605 RepID=A0AAV1DY46_OLDCO|nr:OLC1v1013077C1 [Oldenlandia corymbosa var. corymbosa]
MADEQEISIQQQLSLQILLSNRIVKSAKEAESSKSECTELSLLLHQLIELLVSLARLATTIPAAAFYDRPFRRVTFDLSKTLQRAFTLTRRCKHRKSAKNVIRSMFSISTSADVDKVSILLKTSIADLKWLHAVYDFNSGSFNISLPPMACNDPILAWVWSYIVVLHMGSMKERTDAAQELAAIALINDRNKKIIIDENGIGPLLKLLKESVTGEAQIAAATALFNLGNSRDRVRLIANNDNHGVSTIVKLLFEMPPMSVLVELVSLIWGMAEFDDVVKEEFGRQNVVRPLVTLLGMDSEDEVKKEEPKRTNSMHSVVLMNRQITRNVSGSVYGNSKSLNYGNRWDKEREREMESPEVKLKLKENCAMALWKLVKGSLLNGKKIMETKGLLVLAKIIEKEKGVLQINCLMTVMELAAVAEYNGELRRTAFKPNSPVAKAVLDQLLRVINEDKDPHLLIPAIRAIGCLARTFPAKEARIIEPLVALLGNGNGEVVREVALALGKFVRPDNFNCFEHSKAVAEFDGVAKLVELLRANKGSQFHVLLLLCYLAIHAGDNKAFEQAQVLSVFDGDTRHTLGQYPDLCDLFAKARQHLILYQAQAGALV